MRPAPACLLLLAGCASAPGPAAPPPAAPPEQVWRGTLDCDPVPGVARRVLAQHVELRVAGSVARYQRTLLQAETGGPASVRESGEGTVSAGGPLTLKGEAAGRTFTYTAEYSGVLAPDSRTARLQGYQHWTFPHRPAADRACRINLRREA